MLHSSFNIRAPSQLHTGKQNVGDGDQTFQKLEQKDHHSTPPPNTQDNITIVSITSS